MASLVEGACFYIIVKKWDMAERDWMMAGQSQKIHNMMLTDIHVVGLLALSDEKCIQHNICDF